jgi:formate dehydrogenase subunit gamma
MSILLRGLQLWAAALLFLVLLAVPESSVAQQPVNPTANAVQERQLLREMRIINGRGSIPDVKSYNIEQPAGRDWRQFHEVTLRWIGAIAILGMLLVLVIFYLWKGMVRMRYGRSGRTIVRFNAGERFVHWMTATCFVVLGITGLNITFGKSLLLPLMGPDAFSVWSEWAKYAHDYLSFPFTLGVFLIFVMWIAGNVPTKLDLEWFKQGGGLLDDKSHPPADRFNAGQKMIYWIVVGGGFAMAVSGYALLFPFYVTDVAGMQWAEIVHGTVAVLFVAVILAHIYIGTIGMEGAFEGMGSGTVDLNWAKQHHSVWLQKEQEKTHEPGHVGAGAAPAE